MDAQEKKFKEMTEPPVEKLICRLAVPCIISMLVTSFYNMADTFFVGLLHSNAATGAVGVVFSMMAIIQAVGFFFGQGSGTFISRSLGQKDTKAASEMASTGFFSALTIGIIVCLIGELNLESLAYLLGSTDTMLSDTKSYLGYILLGAPFIIGSFVLNNQLRFQGGAMYAMVGIASGAVLNIILDPILIFACNMGVGGAGLATSISQCFSFILMLIGCSKGGNIAIRIKNFRLKGHYFYMILRGGLPSLARQSLSSLATICLNHAAGPFGDAAIAAMGVVQRIAMFGASTMLGFGQGFQPVCGFNYGAGFYDRVKKGFWFCIKVSTCVLAGVAALGFAFAPQLISLFRDDPQVIEYGALALRMQCIAFPVHGWIVMSNMMQQSTNKTIPATFLSVARQGLFFIPIVLIMSNLLGMLGVQMAQATADLLTFLCALPLQLHILKKMKK